MALAPTSQVLLQTTKILSGNAILNKDINYSLEKYLETSPQANLAREIQKSSVLHLKSDKYLLSMLFAFNLFRISFLQLLSS